MESQSEGRMSLSILPAIANWACRTSVFLPISSEGQNWDTQSFSGNPTHKVCTFDNGTSHDGSVLTLNNDLNGLTLVFLAQRVQYQLEVVPVPVPAD